MNWAKKLWGWEGFLLAVLLIIMVVNSSLSEHFLTVGNQVNLFQLSVEKIIVAVIMTLIIINGEIDLSVASMMGLAACAFAWLFQLGVPSPLAIVTVLAIGALGGLVNAIFITRVGLPSLVVTLATLIGFRGIARILVEDRGVTGFPDWFNALGQQALVGPFTLSLLLFVVIFIGFAVLLHASGFGRKVFVVGNNAAMAAYSGVDVASVKTRLFVASGVISALAGLLYTARVGAVRGDVANGFELDIITMVLLGGISIFGGVGTLLGALLSILIVLNLRNGMALADITGHVQTGVIGLLLILSVGIPNLKSTLGRGFARQTVRE
ncbi:ABC transporter permease [Devosia alba]|uniref:ABC transporter permease n=1 Tax=Devosia alba TaxID=3152360 RepID=UPI003264B283